MAGTDSAGQPRFRVLDIVEVDDEPGWRGVVTEIRRYPDAQIRYSIRQLADDLD
jgi:hypothetical protein